MLLEYNREHCDPPKSDTEVARIARDISTRYPARIDLLGLPHDFQDTDEWWESDAAAALRRRAAVRS